MRSDLYTPVQAISFLSFYDPQKHKRPRTEKLTWLRQRQLLVPVKLGKKTLRYKKKDLEKLLEMAEAGTIDLTAKPTKEEIQNTQK